MGRLSGQEQEDWELPSERILKELPSLQEPRQQSLFQRIARQRAVYFADVEDDPDGSEDEDGFADFNGGKKPGEDKAGDQSKERLPPSGFADLSTWCCDAFLPVRPNSASLKARSSARMSSIVDQPTMILSLLAPSPVHIADLPTQPNLIALSVPLTVRECSRGNGFSLHTGKLWSMLARFCQRFLRIRRMRRARKKQPTVSKGHELLMERLRERQQKGIFAIIPAPPGQRPPHQVRLPVDRLLG